MYRPLFVEVDIDAIKRETAPRAHGLFEIESLALFYRLLYTTAPPMPPVKR